MFVSPIQAKACELASSFVEAHHPEWIITAYLVNFEPGLDASHGSVTVILQKVVSPDRRDMNFKFKLGDPNTLWADDIEYTMQRKPGGAYVITSSREAVH